VSPMKAHLNYILGPPVLTLIFLCTTWGYMRAIRRGRPLTRRMRGMLAYGAPFVLGMLYDIALGAGMLQWPAAAWVSLIALWGAVLGFIAWRRHRAPPNRTQ
jgi:hypothetical protein